MPAVTGGNLIYAVTATITIMIIVILVAVGYIYNLKLDNLLSLSLNQIISEQSETQTTETETDKEEEETSEEKPQQKDQKDIAPRQTREALGFVPYPTVKINNRAQNIFSPEYRGKVPQLSEERIKERCSHYTIPFNRQNCLQAERACASAISSDGEHWDCLESKGYNAGKSLK